ncbi:hypothetical protein BOTBODRAFT_65631 [Botryobasidium botryosum FD-172 SS1]|uniref:LIM zinc-binding domain-containing protein n=1 Tax=Botryobasidium botryosum (strain FD-172 SS1) TaxID=930990 RepID=A0A067MIB2_BOTB1|nr:hypothetical protein BOTBODRAFT_65631 [Botryobasidium botryosum FD-172 SS1]
MNNDTRFAGTPSTSHPVCGGCDNVMESETGGTVISFGSALWHIECFRCAECGNRITADADLRILANGSPVCANCTYHCGACNQKISDDAIMTGDESYHPACFTCRACARRIEELVFAKTIRGIYCMDCHRKRVARSRRHAEAKGKRDKSAEGDRKTKEKPQDAGLGTMQSKL